MSIEKVRQYFKGIGIEEKIKEFPVSSATVELAAKAEGIIPGRICKTISFQDGEDGCILVQTAGDTKINSGKFKKAFGIKAKMLSAEDVLKFTGHEVGGVCAFGIDHPSVRVYADVSMKRFDTMFPACGSSNSAIELTNDELFTYSKALKWVDVCKITEEK
ncbi:MAG: YbaK/EbsC family protein [Anaerovoracaceae bacterium]